VRPFPETPFVGRGILWLADVVSTNRVVHARRADPRQTLGTLLYPPDGGDVVTEHEWAALVRAVAAGDQGALEELYERTNRIVFTLAVRLTSSPHSAEEVTVDVFHEVWRRAADYDPAGGTVVGWVMNLARSRAIDRVRHDRRKKRLGAGPPAAETAHLGPEVVLELKQEAGRVREALERLTVVEREAIEIAFFSELTYAETATRLDQPLGTVKTRIRSALAKLRQALERP
jgi:RNA polymerase sigma-70 factor (ECF subfamily)